jgi:predicted GNAT family N-acyltransferase
MSLMPTFSRKRPIDCTKHELAEFEALVLEGGEVDPVGLTGRILGAKFLVFARRNEQLIGVAAIKKPGNKYRQKTGVKAQFELPGEAWPFELGWVFIQDDRRGKGLSYDIVDCALDDFNDPIFATTRADNLGMHKPLLAAKFEQAGDCYPSDSRACWMLLFVRARPHQ